MTTTTAIVIDDDYNITGVLAELLELQGVRVLGTGYNGVDAIQLFKEHSPDLVLMDVHMPIKDGIAALREIKNISPMSSVIMITGDLSTSIEEQLQTFGANAIIAKPFSMKNIIQIIKEIQKPSEILN